MRRTQRKVFAAATLVACLLLALPAYGAQGSAVEPRPQTADLTGSADTSVGTNVTVAYETENPEDDSLHITSSAKRSVTFTEEDGYVNDGPGAVNKQETDTKSGESLGEFTITGYCNCPICSGGHNLTYSGTVPQPNHTLSADLNLFPIGTRLMIDGTVYTVEDMGSSVNGKKLDIFYGTHEEAVAAGTYTAEVFRAD